MTTPAERRKHACGVVVVGGLAEDHVVAKDGGIGNENRACGPDRTTNGTKLRLDNALEVLLRTFTMHDGLIHVCRLHLHRKSRAFEQLAPPR